MMKSEKILSENQIQIEGQNHELNEGQIEGPIRGK